MSDWWCAQSQSYHDEAKKVFIISNTRWEVGTDMSRSAFLSLAKLSSAGGWEVLEKKTVCLETNKNWANETNELNRKGVGSGDAVERGCGWEEEMREELRREWSAEKLEVGKY